MMTDEQKARLNELVDKYYVINDISSLIASSKATKKALDDLTRQVNEAHNTFGQYLYLVKSNNWKKLHKIPMKRIG